MSNSTKKARPSKSINKPKKPYPEFPLYYHNLGYISKKVGGKIVHFGRWARVKKGVLTALPFEASWQQALANYKARIDDVQADPDQGGTIFEADTIREGLTLRELVNEFLTSKKRKQGDGDITERTFNEYKYTCVFLLDTIGRDRLVEGIRPTDFGILRSAMAKRWGPVRLATTMTRVRTLFKHAIDNDLIHRAVRFGSEFDKPSKTVMRKHAANRGKKFFEREEIISLLGVAGVQARAMILVGVNCGFGCGDISSLPFSALDLDGGFVSYHRPKTGVERRCPLWPKTIQALKAAIEERTEPKHEAAAELVFLDDKGKPFVVSGRAQPISIVMNFLMKQAGVYQPGRGFYGLRHSFRTAADGCKDEPAIRIIMGHADSGIDDVYRHRIEDHRLVAVTDFVHAWLFGTDDDGGGQRSDTEPAATDAPNAESVSTDDGPSLRLFAG